MRSTILAALVTLAVAGGCVVNQPVVQAPTVAAQAAAAPDARFAGSWRSTSYEGETLTIAVVGDRAEGSYVSAGFGGYQGTFVGTIEGRVFTGRWTQTGETHNGAGIVTFTLTPDGNSFTGTYTRESGQGSRAGAWSAARQ
jgi:hypothetical protein